MKGHASLASEIVRSGSLRINLRAILHASALAPVSATAATATLSAQKILEMPPQHS